MVISEILPRSHEEAARSAGRVTDDILSRGGRQLDHELNDVTRCPELAVPAS